jgi:hypothetical protein
MFEKLVFGPSYPVGSCELPVNATWPSPSKANGGLVLVEVRRSEGTAWLCRNSYRLPVPDMGSVPRAVYRAPLPAIPHRVRFWTTRGREMNPLKRVLLMLAIVSVGLGTSGCALLGLPPIKNPPSSPPPAASLEIDTRDTYTCGNFTCWGTVSWSGLRVPSLITFSGTNVGDPAPITVLSTSATDQGVNLACGSGLANVVATGRTASGTTISSAPVNSPCG